MSEARPKRMPREPTRDNGIRTEASPVEPVDTAPKTATATIALETTAAAETMAEAPAAATGTAEKITATVDALWADPWAAWAESQSALARGFEALATEATGMTRSGITAAADAAKAMLAAKTLVEAIEINAAYARRSFDAAIGGTAKLSEIGVKAATDASRPLINRLGETWNSLRAH
ncbi:MAG TPA: phasin family protein [Stellaceae bacterium]|jgi:phasin family protein|nr:phasin family protein [Stellaceae bacterium]